MLEPYNSVPSGEAGDGAAYILPQGSVAVNQYLNTAADQREQAQKAAAAAAKAKLEAAQAMAASYRENAFKAKNGTLWNNELLTAQQKHVEQGSKYAQQGFDIYNPNPNNPNEMAAHDQYMSDRAKIYNMQDVREQLATHLTEQDKKASESEPGKYDPDSINDLHNFYNSNKLSDIVNKGLQAPYLREAFDPATHIVSKLKEATAMTPETEYVKNGLKITSKQFKPVQTGRNIESLLTNTPGGENYVRKQTGLSPSEAQQIPDNIKDVSDFNDQQFRNTDAGRKAVLDAGITSYSDPRYQQLVDQKSQQDFARKQAYKNFLGNYVNMARSGASEVDKRVPDFTGENQGYTRERMAHERTEWAKGDAKNDGGDIVFGNGESTVPVLKETKSGGKIVPQIIGSGKKGGTVLANSTVEPEQGATLFTQNFPQTKMMVSPGKVITLKNGHSVPSSGPFEVNAGSVKMEPVFTGLDDKDSRNGAVMSKRQLLEAVEGKGQFSLKNISFQPTVYGTRPIKNDKGKTEYEPVAFNYNSVRGNDKLKTAKFEQTEKQFQELLASPDFKALNEKQRMDFLSKQFNIQ